MDNADFESMKRGLAQAKDFISGKREGFVVHEPVNIKALRLRAKMSQRKFALSYHLPLGTVKDWEQGRRQPDAPARALLAIIEKDPDAAAKALSDA